MKRESDALTENLQELKSAKLEEIAKQPQMNTSREMRKDVGENDLLRGIGRRMTPDGARHHSSFAVHVYQKKHSIDAVILTQVNNIEGLPEMITQAALKELTLHIMKKYGHKPPRKLNEEAITWEGEIENSLITPPDIA